MSQLSIESTSAPKSALQKPAMRKPGTISVIAQKRSAFRTNENSPNVRIVTGKVRIERTGLMTVAMTDQTSATRSVVSNPPLTRTPGTSRTVSKTAAPGPN